MDKLLKDHPDISRKIFHEISRKLIQTENLVQNLSTNDTNSKVAYVLIQLADTRGKIEIPVNREEMANYAGVTRETMSRKLSSLEKSNIIETKGNKVILIKDREALLELF